MNDGIHEAIKLSQWNTEQVIFRENYYYVVNNLWESLQSHRPHHYAYPI